MWSYSIIQGSSSQIATEYLRLIPLSCAAIEAGENALASDFLQRAEALGKENELDDDDVAVHKCQRAYLDFCSGNKDAALASFKVRHPPTTCFWLPPSSHPPPPFFSS